MSFTPFGPGTIQVGATGSEASFEAEVLGGKVTHTYEDVGDSRTMLDGTQRGATRRRTDGLAFSVENDLTAAGMYQFCLTNDGTDQPFVYTPNTAGGASWAGSVSIALPAEIGADEFNAPIVSDVEWSGVGSAFTFTPEPATP